MTDIPSYIDWKVGDKVVCIDNSGQSYRDEGYDYPSEGPVYTVREIVQFGFTLCILLDEIRNPDGHTTLGWREPGFNINRFRPVQTKKPSIEIFNRILLNPRIRISEDA